MRTIAIGLMILWLGACGLLVAAHESPARLENALDALNEKFGGSFALPNKALPYEVAGMATALTTPFLLLLIVLSATKTSRQLRTELTQSAAEVRRAKVILAVQRQRGRTVGEDLDDLEDESRLDDLGTLEKEVATLEKRVEASETAEVDQADTVSRRFRSLQERLENVSRAARALDEGRGSLRQMLDAAAESKEAVEGTLDNSEGDDPVDQIDTLERAAGALEERLKALESLSPRAVALRDSLSALAARLQGMENRQQESMLDMIGGLEQKKEKLEEDLEAASCDDKGDFVDAVTEWEEELRELEQRVTGLEGLALRAIAFEKALTTLQERLDKADGDERRHLSTIVEDVGTARDGFVGALEEAEGEDLLGTVEGWEDELSDLADRIKILEELGPRVQAFHDALKAIDVRLNTVQEQNTARLQPIIERLKEKIGGDLDDLEGHLSSDDVDALETERDALRERFEAVKEAACRGKQVQADLEALQEQLAELRN